MADTDAKSAAVGLMNFIDDSPSPFHATASVTSELVEAGFRKLAEDAEWKLERGQGYFVTRNDSSVIAFAVGGQYEVGNGLSMIGAHTDSPCLKLKPESNLARGAYLSLGVEVYGGPILHTWFDRDLGLAGRVVVRDGGVLSARLVNLSRPILRVPTLAIHLDRSVNESFAFNKESDLAPMFATAVKAALVAPETGGAKPAHPPLLLEMLAKELGVAPDAIVDFDLCCYDVQAAALGGALEEFVFAARIDNLGMTFCSTRALVAAMPSLGTEQNIRLVALFDNEEVGSETAHGANSSYMQSTIGRILGAFAPADGSVVERTMARSFLVSADMAHAVHPNQPGKHGATGAPVLNKGPVLKSNAQARYATTGLSSAILKEVAHRAGVRLQQFSCRNDIPCGSTIGPMTSALLGVRCADMGNPQLSMHSARECCGADDVVEAIRLFTAFFTHFPDIDSGMRAGPGAEASARS